MYRFLPFQSATNCQKGLVETVKLYGFGNKLKSPYWRSAILESIDRMYRGSLTSTEQLTRRTGLGPNYKTWIPSRELTPSNRLFLHRRSIFEDSFIPVLSENWAEFARPDTVIKICFDRADLGRLFNSGGIEYIDHILRPQVNAGQDSDKEVLNKQEGVVPQAKEVKDQDGHHIPNQQEEARATSIVKPEENRPFAQSKLGKRVNFLRRH